MKTRRSRTASIRRIRLKRHLEKRRLRLEPLEERTLLAAFTDAGNNDTVSSAQLLFNDTSYTVNGRLDQVDLDFYTFYAKTGDNLKVTAAAVFNGAPPTEDKQFDPMVAIYDPSGSMVQQDDDGGGTQAIPWTAVSNYTATESGFWTVGVTDYPDFDFDGTIDSGPGLNTGKYQLKVEGVSKFEIDDSSVTAQYDNDSGNTTFGEYLPWVSLQNTFTVDLGNDLPDGFRLEYWFGGLKQDPVQKASGSGGVYTFSQDMGRLRPEHPSLTIQLVHSDSGSVFDEYTASVKFVDDLSYTLEFDGVAADELRLIGKEINEGEWPVKATIPTEIDFFDQYKLQDLSLRRKSKGAGTTTSTGLTAQGDGTFTGTFPIDLLTDTVKDGKDWEMALMGTVVTGNPKPFSRPIDVLVVSYPKWISLFTVDTAVYSEGWYDIAVNTSKWKLDVTPTVPPGEDGLIAGLVKGIETGASLDISLFVTASRKLGDSEKPEAELKSASVSTTLLGDRKTYTLDNQLVVASTLNDETLDVETFKISNRDPIKIADRIFPSFNQKFKLPSYLTDAFGYLGIDANLNLSGNSSPLTANVGLEMGKNQAGDFEWKSSGTYVEFMAGAFGQVTIGAGLSLLSLKNKGLTGIPVPDKGLLDVEVTGHLKAALAAKVRFEASGNLLKPTPTINKQKSGATLGVDWSINARGDAFFGLFEVFDKTFKSNGIEVIKLLGDADLKSNVTTMIKDGKGIAPGTKPSGVPQFLTPPSNLQQSTPISAVPPPIAPTAHVPTLQGSLRHLQIIPSTVSNVAVEIQSFADRADLTEGAHRLDVVLVGQSNELTLGSFDPAHQTYAPDANPLGYAAPIQNVSYPIDPASVDADEFYHVEFRYFADGDAGGEVVEYQVYAVDITIPESNYDLTAPLGSLDDSTLTFGPETGQSAVGTLLLTNTSDVALTVKQLELVGEGVEILSPADGPFIVEAGQAVALDLRLIDETQAADATLRIHSNAPGKTVYEVALVYDPAVPVDVTPPEMTALNLRSSAWESADPSLPVTGPFGAYGNLDQIEVVFSEAVDVVSDDARLVDATGSTVAVSAFHFAPTTFTATWTLANPLPAGHYSLEWNGEIHDRSSNALAPPEPTPLPIVPGDANGDRITNFEDYVIVSNHFGQDTDGALEGDFNGDGVTDFLDFVTLSNQFGTDQADLAVVNLAPVIESIDDQWMLDGQTLNLTFNAGDGNPSDTLTFSLTDAPIGATLNEQTGEFQFTAPTGQGFGEYPVTLRVTDDGQPVRWTEASFLIVTQPVNVAPVIDPVTPMSVEQGDPFLYRMTVSDGNEPFDTFTFSLDQAPEGATIDPETGSIRWEPGFDVPPGDVPFTVRVTDGLTPNLGDTLTFNVTLTEFNLPPTLDPIENVETDEGELVTFTATASDPNAGTALHFSLDGAPDGAFIDPKTGTFTWTPTEAQGAGDYYITVVVTDNGTQPRSDSDQLLVQVRELNVAPELAAIGTQSIEAGQTLSFLATATDVDVPENNLVYSLDAGAPDGVMIDPATGEIHWTPAFDQVGSYQITVRVTDDAASPLDDFETVSIEVTPETQPPLISAYLTESYRDPNTATDAGISGGVIDVSPIVEFGAAFGNPPIQSYVDLLDRLDLESEFYLDETILGNLNGAAIEEGTHTIHFRAVDSRGNTTLFEYTFTIDQTPPTLMLEIDPSYDSAPLGDLETNFESVTLIAHTEPFASVYLDTSLPIAIADEFGIIRYEDFRLELGQRDFQSFLEDVAGNTAEIAISITRITDNGCVGPDGFGYQACATTPEFIDISSTGTSVLAGAHLDSVELTSVDLAGFQFEFYGVPVDNLFINSNGLITFEEAYTEFYSGTWSGQQLFQDPNQSAIAPLWNDITVAGGVSSAVFWELVGTTGSRELIVQWEDVKIGYNYGRATFQAVLREQDHSIQFNYRTLTPGVSFDQLHDSTVGIKPPGSGLPPTLRLAYGSLPNELVAEGSSTLISVVQPDTIPPLVVVGLANDSGEDAFDSITNDATIEGGIYDFNPIVTVAAGLNTTVEAEFVDILGDLQPDGSFQLDLARLEQILGGSLEDGSHTLRLIAEDSLANRSEIAFSFVLDRVGPVISSLTLAQSSDSEPLGDGRTTFPFVELVGRTEPDAFVSLPSHPDPYGDSNEANSFGIARFYNILLQLGTNEIVFESTDLAGNVSQEVFAIERVPRASIGPNGFGYEAFTSSTSFVDISETGTLLNRSTIDSATALSPAELNGFEFEFYGTTYDSLYVSDNGLITFGSPNSNSFGSLFSTGMPSIAPLWDSLRVTFVAGSGLFYQVTGTEGEQELIVQWSDYQLGFDGGAITFQAILHEADGSIDFIYPDLETSGPGLAERNTAAGISIGVPFSYEEGALFLLQQQEGENEFVATGSSVRIALSEPDIFAPLVAASLSNDTGEYDFDGQTMDPSVSGFTLDSNDVVALRAGIDSLDTTTYTDITPYLQPDGSFALDAEAMELIFGSTIPDGIHFFYVTAEDVFGNVSDPSSVRFDLDTTASAPALNIVADFDTEPLGDLQTLALIVRMEGQWEPYSEVYVQEIDETFYLDDSGHFDFRAELAVGPNGFTTEFTDPAGNVGTQVTTVTRIPRTQFGPDDWGYEAHAVQPMFNDISATGTSILADADDEVHELTPTDLGGFQFTMYGSTFDAVFIDSNGIIKFGSHNFSQSQGNLRSTSFFGAPAIAPLWDDLAISGSPESALLWEVQGTPGNRDLIIQWNEVTYMGETGTITFQAVLHEADGSIDFNYLDIDSDGASSGGAEANVGINSDYVFDTDEIVQAFRTGLTPVFRDGPNEFAGSGLSTQIRLVNPDSVGPMMTVMLANDSNGYRGGNDGITNDSSVRGIVVDASGINVLRAGFNETLPIDFVDILSDLRADGSFLLDANRIDQILGSGLPDGVHTLHLYAEDALGNPAAFDLQFEFDTQAPIVTGLGLSAATDSFPLGDDQTTIPMVEIIGQSESFQYFIIEENGILGFADTDGNLQFSNVPIYPGQNEFTISATDNSGNTATYSITLTLVIAAGPDGFGYEAYTVPFNYYETGLSSFRRLSDGVDSYAEYDFAPHNFEFEFYGVTYDRIYVNADGFLSLEHPGAAAFNQPIISPLESAYVLDQEHPYEGTVNYGMIGEVGSRKAVIEWEDLWSVFNNSLEPVTFQVALHEADGTIEFNYKRMAHDDPSQTLFGDTFIKADGQQQSGESILTLREGGPPDQFVGSGKSILIVLPSSPPPPPAETWTPDTIEAPTTSAAEPRPDKQVPSGFVLDSPTRKRADRVAGEYAAGFDTFGESLRRNRPSNPLRSAGPVFARERAVDQVLSSANWRPEEASAAESLLEFVQLELEASFDPSAGQE
ncbi:Cadherin domain protein [Stieleria maiorica]|uniref:Cadherin domain protein n=1 Tax=Stieleria maiorica TaxID=2795974 RepID=A0A5B9MBJ7_9BACT|nr:putative Ig domain-containing protein [Stieleria maiorica]QEF98562.1 Cadherin domain protein [Stieleria maiorica]